MPILKEFDLDIPYVKVDGNKDDYENSDTVQGNTQWVCDLETGKLIQVAPQAKSSWLGVWSPDELNGEIQTYPA